MTIRGDIDRLRGLGWSYTRIGAHYGVSEREVGRWHRGETFPDRPTAPPLALNWGTAFIVNDVQFPSWDPALFEVATQIARDAEVDRVIWDGDNLDFEQLSSFAHNPYKITTARKDVARFHADVYDPFRREVPTLVEEDWNDGNHEYRVQRYLEHNAAALGELFDQRDFLELPEEVRFHSYGKGVGTWLTPKLLVAHGWQASKWSAYTAKANLMDVGGQVSVITGHTHRVGVFMHTTPGGVQASYEVGHMCDPALVPKAIQGVNDWQQVAGTIVRYERGGDAFHVELLPVIGSKQDRVIANGREYRLERGRRLWAA